MSRFTALCTSDDLCAPCFAHEAHASALAAIDADCACECAYDTAMNETREYNTRYADYITRRAAMYAASGVGSVNEQDLINAHAWAAFDTQACPPPDGYPQAPATTVDGCSRCDGTGFVAFYWVDGGVCWECNWDHHIKVAVA